MDSPLPPAYHESLPYIDPPPSETALVAARALIEADDAAHRQQRPSRDPGPLPPPQSPLLAAELARVASSTALAPLSLARYEAQQLPPAGPDAPSLHRLGSVLADAYSSATYLAARRRNLDLLHRHGASAWLLANYQLEALLASYERRLADSRALIDQLNADRAARQEAARPEMLALDQAWKRGLAAVLETELALEHLRSQIRLQLSHPAPAPPPPPP